MILNDESGTRTIVPNRLLLSLRHWRQWQSICYGECESSCCMVERVYAHCLPSVYTTLILELPAQAASGGHFGVFSSLLVIVL